MSEPGDGQDRKGAGVAHGPTAHGELVSVLNGAGLVLDGLLFRPPDARLIVVHVHGSLGNFYQQPFIRVFANRLRADGIALLSCNLTTHDGISEGYSAAGDMSYVGGSVSTFESCLDDLDGLVRFAHAICPRVVLQGHSLGCDRILYYTQQRAAKIPLILLSPCDSYHLHERWLGGSPFGEQVARLKERATLGMGDRLLEDSEYGVVGPNGWTYSIPVSGRTLLSIVTGAAFRTLRVDATVAEAVTTAPAFVYLGLEDAIRGASVDDLMAHLRRLLPAARTFVVREGDHSLTGCEATVAEAIARWTYEMDVVRGWG